MDDPAACRVLEESGKVFPVQEFVAMVPHDDFYAQWFGAGLYDGHGLGEAVAVDEEPVACALADASGNQHGLRRGSSFVQQGGVGQFHPRQVHDHLLESDQDFQPGLADLRLVGGIGRVPVRVLHDIAPDDRRGHCTVVSHADHRYCPGVVGRNLPGELVEAVLVKRAGQGKPVPAQDGCRNGLLDQFVKRCQAQGLQHPDNLVGA